MILSKILRPLQCSKSFVVPTMGISSVLIGVAGLAAGAAILCNLPTNPFIPSPERATLQYLASSKLSTINKDPSLRREFLAEDLWKKNGVVVMAVRRPG